MTILDKIKTESTSENHNPTPSKSEAKQDSSQSELSSVESQFKNIMAEFNAQTGFSVNTSEPPSDTMVEILSSKSVMVSITILLAYIRYCVNHGLKKDITLKIGYNKPPSVPMNFAINEEMLEDIYPGDTVDIN